MFKKLHIKIKEAESDRVVLQVIEQSHRGGDFGKDFPNGNLFYSSLMDNMVLGSSSCPAWDDTSSTRVLFVRGSDTAMDDRDIIMTVSDFQSVLPMILEYNQYYNKNKLVAEDVVTGLSKWENLNA